MIKQVAYGDSLTNPGLEATTGNAWLTRLAMRIGLGFSNLALAGGMTADAAVYARGNPLFDGDLAVIQLGTNELHVYGPDATKQAYFEAFLRSLILDCAAPAKTAANLLQPLPDATTPGTWVPFDLANPAMAGGMQSWLGGYSLNGTFTGTALYVRGVLQEPEGVAPDGRADIIIDGVTVGNIGSDGTGMHTGAGNTAKAPAAWRFVPAPTADNHHTFQIKMTTNVHTFAGMFRMLDISTNTQAAKPLVVVGNVPRWTAAAYAAVGGGSSDVVVAQLNAIIAKVCGECVTDGLNVRAVDTCSAFNTTTHLSPGDGYHWSDDGHAVEYGLMHDAIVGGVASPPPVLYDPAYVFRESVSGNYFLASDAAGTLNRKPL